MGTTQLQTMKPNFALITDQEPRVGLLERKFLEMDILG